MVQKPINKLRKKLEKGGAISINWHELEQSEFKKAIEKMKRLGEIITVQPLNLPKAPGWKEYRKPDYYVDALIVSTHKAIMPKLTKTERKKLERLQKLYVKRSFEYWETLDRLGGISHDLSKKCIGVGGKYKNYACEGITKTKCQKINGRWNNKQKKCTL